MKTINNAHSFLIILVSGLLATFVMTLVGFWQTGIGINAVDVGAMLSGSMTAANPEMTYGLWAGNIMHFGIGVLLATLYVAFLQGSLPGNWLFRGVGYGIILWIAATLIVVPLTTPNDVFFLNTPRPGMMMLASLIPHLAYGVSLTLALYVAGLEPTTERTARRREVAAPAPIPA